MIIRNKNITNISLNNEHHHYLPSSLFFINGVIVKCLHHMCLGEYMKILTYKLTKNKFNIFIIINESFMLINNTLTKAMCIKQHSSALFFHNTFVHNLLLIYY